ncbi:MAG: hypothetical protein JNN00_11240 [Chitinophagaceae bacterium]|nr:hypothetical protein [Chitinophagaceae bacterium]
MRKALFLRVMLACSFILVIDRMPAKASFSPFPPEPWQQLKLSEFIKLKPVAFGQQAGRRLNLLQKFSFGILKQKMKKTLHRKGDQTVGEFLATNRHRYKWWYIVLIIGLAILMVIVFINVIRLGS